MTQKSLVTWISGDTAIAGTSRSRLLRLLRRSDFSGRRKKPELLPLNAADRASPRPLTKIQDEENITIHRPGRSTYPEEKSVLTSGATPIWTRSRRACSSAGRTNPSTIQAINDILTPCLKDGARRCLRPQGPNNEPPAIS